MSSKRKSEISLLNVLLCLFVIFIHIDSFPIAFYPKGSALYTLYLIPSRLVSFVVPGFVLLSGTKLFLGGKENIGYFEYLKKRFISVYFPYLVCFICYYIYYMLVYDYPLDLQFIFNNFIFGSLACHFYFIPLLFQFDLLLPLWKRLINSVSPIIIIPIVLIFSNVFECYFPNILSITFPNASFIYNDRLFTTYLSFWIIGCYIGKNYERFLELLEDNFKAICILFSAVTILNVYYSVIAFNDLCYVPFMNTLHYTYSICAIIFFFSLFYKTASLIVAKLPLLLKIDRVSYDIYLWHILVLFVTNSIIEEFGINSQPLSFIIRLVFVTTITIALAILKLTLKKKLLKQK